MWRFPKTNFLIAGARGSAWLLVFALLWYTGAFAQLTNPQSLIWLSYMTLYTLLWMWHLPRFIARARDGSVVVLYDLLLSALPVWFTGGWASPFLPFMLSAIVVPAAIRGWSSGMLIAAATLAIDQVILWTTPRDPWELAIGGQSLSLLGRTLLPFGIAAIVTISVDLWRWWRRMMHHRSQEVPPAPRWEYPPVQSLMGRASDDAPVAYNRAARAERPVAETWSKERAHQPTLERRPPITIQGTLRNFMPDFTAAGVSVAMQIEGDERRLPPRIRELLMKAIEIALDNVLSHARAQSVKVAVQIATDAVSLCVSDDGIGLFDGTAEPPGFHQVKRLRYRAQELGGALQVGEREEGGVELQLRLPIVE
jgi:hypothetical protein